MGLMRGEAVPNVLWAFTYRTNLSEEVHVNRKGKTGASHDEAAAPSVRLQQSQSLPCFEHVGALDTEMIR